MPGPFTGANTGIGNNIFSGFQGISGGGGGGMSGFNSFLSSPTGSFLRDFLGGALKSQADEEMEKRRLDSYNNNSKAGLLQRQHEFDQSNQLDRARNVAAQRGIGESQDFARQQAIRNSIYRGMPGVMASVNIGPKDPRIAKLMPDVGAPYRQFASLFNDPRVLATVSPEATASSIQQRDLDMLQMDENAALSNLDSLGLGNIQNFMDTRQQQQEALKAQRLKASQDSRAAILKALDQQAAEAKQQQKKTTGSRLSGAASGAMSGAAAGSVIPGIGTGIGAAIGGLIGLFK